MVSVQSLERIAATVWLLETIRDFSSPEMTFTLYETTLLHDRKDAFKKPAIRGELSGTRQPFQQFGPIGILRVRTTEERQ